MIVNDLKASQHSADDLDLAIYGPANIGKTLTTEMAQQATELQSRLLTDRMWLIADKADRLKMLAELDKLSQVIERVKTANGASSALDTFDGKDEATREREKRESLAKELKKTKDQFDRYREVSRRY